MVVLLLIVNFSKAPVLFIYPVFVGFIL